MFYRKNVGSKEGMARIALGAAMVGIGLFQFGPSPAGWGLAASGVFTALTGVFGYCPACAMLGRKPQDRTP
jgi:hypothetical protein